MRYLVKHQKHRNEEPEMQIILLVSALTVSGIARFSNSELLLLPLMISLEILSFDNLRII